MRGGKKKAPIPGLEKHGRGYRWTRMHEGKKVRVTLHARTEEEAIEEVKLLQKQAPSKQSGGWEEAVAGYLASRPHGKPLSLAVVTSRGPVLMTIGRELRLPTPLSLTPALADRWLSSLQARVKRKEIVVSTLAHYVRDLRSFIRWCLENGRMVADPTSHFSVALPQPKFRKVFLYPEQIRKLLAAARNQGDRDMEFVIALGSECAMRRSEIDACRPEWFDLRQRLVRIPSEEEIEQTNGRVWKRKGRDERRREAIVPLSDVMLEIIGHWKLPEPFVVRPQKDWGANRYRYEFKKRYKAFLASHGHSEVSLHDLRRSFASNRVSAGVEMAKVANWMGIELKTAWERYSRFIPRDAEINRGSSAAGAPMIAAEPAQPASSLPWAARLERLKDLVTAGIISEAEAEAQRARILAEL